MESITRILKTTFKQIGRSGWLAWASIIVITVSFLITIVFAGLVYSMNKVVESMENEPHIYVFFEPGTSELSIQKLESDWAANPAVFDTDYTSEQQAMDEYIKHNQRENPLMAQAIRQDVLPASIGIKLKDIEAAEGVINILQEEEKTNESIYAIGYSEDVINNIKDLAFLFQIISWTIIGMLIFMVLIFTLLTTEFKIFSRSEEIGIMQLVGGGLWYIRLPFVLESTIYGMVGATLSNLILIGSYYGITNYFSESDRLSFINRFFGKIPWPEITQQDLILGFVAIVLIGGLIQMLNSLIAIRRYIK